MSHSTTPDGVPPYFLKRVAHVIAQMLAPLHNHSLMFTEVPKQ